MRKTCPQAGTQQGGSEKAFSGKKNAQGRLRGKTRKHEKTGPLGLTGGNGKALSFKPPRGKESSALRVCLLEPGVGKRGGSLTPKKQKQSPTHTGKCVPSNQKEGYFRTFGQKRAVPERIREKGGPAAEPQIPTHDAGGYN